MTGVTREYFQLINNRSQAVYSSCRMSPARELHTKFLEARRVTRVSL